MKKTAIEWLASQIPVVDWDDPYWRTKLKEAKEMEKEHSIDFARLCLHKAKKLTLLKVYMYVQDYYNETFNPPKQ